MRKYSVDIYNKFVYQRKWKFFDYFYKVYKERLIKQTSNLFFLNRYKLIQNYRRLERLLNLQRHFGFFHYATASRIYDKEGKPLSFYGYWLTQFKLFHHFYNNLTIRVMKRLWNKARKTRIVIFNYFLNLLESRVDSVLIRLNWVHSKHQIRLLLREKTFLVNNIPSFYPNIILKTGECISVNDYGHIKYLRKFFYLLRKRIKKRGFFQKPPLFIEANYRIFKATIINKLISRDYVKYPFKFSCESLLYVSYSKR